VQDDLGVEEVYRMVLLTFSRQGLRPKYDLTLLRRLDAAARQFGSCRILHAQDAQGNIHAGIYIVWDESSAYYLLGGADPRFRTSGAHSLLMWEAIRFASTVSRSFDFEGSMVEPIERFFRSFGARQVPYFHVTRMSRRMRALTSACELVGALL